MAAILTEFGKELRKMRIDAGEVLKDMADKLEITSSYLSAIEVGKRAVPSVFLDKLHDIYHLSEKEMAYLRKSIDADRTRIEVNLQNTNAQQRKTVLAFARTFSNLDDDALENILKLLNKADNEHGNSI